MLEPESMEILLKLVTKLILVGLAIHRHPAPKRKQATRAILRKQAPRWMAAGMA